MPFKKQEIYQAKHSWAPRQKIYTFLEMSMSEPAFETTWVRVQFNWRIKNC